MHPGRLATIDAATTRWQNAPARYPPLSATSKAFLDAAHHAARRGARRRRAGFAVLAMLTALAVAAAGIAFSQRAAVIQQRDQVIYNQVIAEALHYGTTDTPLAAQLTLAAYRIEPSRDLAWSLLNTENTPLPTSVVAGAGFINSVAFSPDGHTLASGDSGGTVQLWDVAQPWRPSLLGQPLASAPGAGQAGGSDFVTSVAFSRDGQTLASGGYDGAIRLWSVADPAHPRLLGSTPASRVFTVNSVAFSPDGHTLASSDSDGTIRLWNVADPRHPSPLGSVVNGGAAIYFLLTPEVPARMSHLAHAVRELCLHLPDAVGWSSWTAGRARRGPGNSSKALEAARLPDDAGGFRVCGEVVT